MRVFVSQRITPEAIERLRRAGLSVDAREEDWPLEPEALRARTAGADALVCLLTDRVDRAVLEGSPRLRVVATVAVGYDHIDVAAASEAGIAVANTPRVLTETTADLTMALLLAVARRIPEGDALIRSGGYRRWQFHQEPLGADVHGRTLGVFGFGQIGRAVARRALHGFAMDVCYHSRSPLSDEEERRLGVRCVDFDTLLADSDFISLHAPLTPQTRHVFAASAFQRMRRSAFLVNTARGPLVDEAALAEALTTGQIAGAGLDVFEDEPAVDPDLLRRHQHVVLLPHLGSATRATRDRMAALAVDAVVEHLSGGRPANLVNADALGSSSR